MGSKASSPTPPPAPQSLDVGAAIGSYLQGVSNPQLQQQILQAEGTYRPQYGNLNLQDYQQQLLGGQTRQFDVQGYLASRPDLVANFQSDPGYAQMYGSLEQYAQADAQGNPQAAQQFYNTVQTPGALDLYNQAVLGTGQTQAQAATQQRTANIQDLEALGGRASAAFAAANPQLQAQLARAQALGAQGYNLSPVTAQSVSAGQVGQGLLGESLYQQALNANQESAVTANLRQQAERLAQSQGQLTGLEQRAVQQGSREGMAARGLLDSNRSLADEIGARIAAQRSRQTEDLSLAGAINSQLLGAQQANRSFATGVYGQELGRGFSNVGNTLQADLANQGADLNAQQFNSQQSLAAQEAERNYALSLAGLYAGQGQQQYNAIFGQPITATGLGAQQQGFAYGSAANQGPQLFDPNAGINLGLQQQTNLANYNASIYGAQAANAGSRAGAGAGLLGAGLTAVGTIFGGPIGGMAGAAIGNAIAKK